MFNQWERERHLRLSAIILARTIGYIEAFDLSPVGKVFFPDLAREIASKYQFQKFPQTLEDFDLSKGIEFLHGKSGDNVILKFSIWGGIVTAETRTSTDDSKAFLEEILLWGADKFGINYQPGSIKRFAYISDLTFYSDTPILSINPALTSLATKTSQALSGIWQEPVEYQPISIKIGHDPTTRKNGIAPFSIERRGDARFSENKYFSEAPLPTSLHWELLEQFEMDLQLTRKAGNV
jgi:hypothetical protein